MSETDRAVLDRIVDGETAVLLLEAEGTVVDEYGLDVERIPEEGRHEGAVFAVTVDAETVRELEYRPAEERDRKASLRDRFDRLSERLSEE